SRRDEAHQLEEEDATLVEALALDARQLLGERGRWLAAGVFAERPGADRRAVEEDHLVIPRVGAQLAGALQSDDVLDERGLLPVLGDAARGDERDQVGGGLRDDGEAGDFQAAQEHGLSGAWRAGEDVALHEVSADWRCGRT